MCGLFGVFAGSHESSIDEALLRRTMRRLEHRGPNDQGWYAGPGIGFAHTRLALIDLDPRSAQPFWDQTGRYCLVYNGEVYNFRELARELESEGIALRTSGDTEVVLEYVIHFGIESALRRFEGMYAFAIWDRERDLLTLARDRFGIKPLFIHRDDDRLIFASEIQALESWVAFEPDLGSIVAFLCGFAGPTDGRTFFEGIEFFPPGSYATVERDEVPRFQRVLPVEDLWDAELHERLAGLSEDQVVDAVEHCLLASVQQQLLADAKVGAFCSGGVDSSLILAMATRTHPDLVVFHADIVGPDSEREAAETLARHLGLDLLVAEVHDSDFIELLPELTLHGGNPILAIPHAVPIYLVSEVVRANGVRAVLTGEGSDEGFLGYEILIPSPTQRRRGADPRTPASERISGVVGPPLLERIYRHFAGTAGRRRAADADLVTGLLSGFEVEAEGERIRRSCASIPDQESRERVVESLELYSHNLRGLLHRNDMAGMAASIESRFPFLDTEVARMAVALPLERKIRRVARGFDPRHPHHVDKWVVREIAKRYVPKELAERAKHGFVSNAYRRLRVESKLFQGSFVAELFRLSREDIDYLLDHAGRMLRARLLHLETWGQVFVRGAACSEVAERLVATVTVKPH